MALNYLVDTLRSFWMRYIDRKQERLHSSTFGDQSSFDDHLKGDESTQTKRKQYNIRYYPSGQPTKITLMNSKF